MCSVLMCALCAGLVSGCTQPLYDAAKATRPYPRELHTTNTLDMQVFRDEATLEIVNATAHSFDDFDLWINQRYVERVDSLPAGETIQLSLWNFYDERGEVLQAGGFFATREPTQVRLVEIQTAEGELLVGLIMVRRDPVQLPQPGR